MAQITAAERDAVLMKAARRALGFWGATDETAEAISGVSAQDFAAAADARLVLPFSLTDDSRERLTMIIAVYKDLHGNFGPQYADSWPANPNHAPVFGGRPPLELMAREGRAGLFSTLVHLRSYAQGF